MLVMNEEEAEAFVEKLNMDKMGGLLPVVVQEQSTNKVLMQAFMNREALLLTLTTGRMHYWSRTRRKIWMKGETSGHYSLIKNVFRDCDDDALLFTVEQIGPVCHTGEYTCFHKPYSQTEKEKLNAEFLERLYEVIRSRVKHREKAYVSELVEGSPAKVADKLKEEFEELLKSGEKVDERKFVHAVADVLFHTLILLAYYGVSLQDVFEELEKLHKDESLES
jgi:phosphoribosyl-ATP pyrophosphohydrolase/phosphoribosyl-AMP cyclohydrolase